MFVEYEDIGHLCGFLCLTVSRGGRVPRARGDKLADLLRENSSRKDDEDDLQPKGGIFPQSVEL